MFPVSWHKKMMDSSYENIIYSNNNNITNNNHNNWPNDIGNENE